MPTTKKRPEDSSSKRDHQDKQMEISPGTSEAARKEERQERETRETRETSSQKGNILLDGEKREK